MTNEVTGGLDPIFGLATDTVWGLACRAKDPQSVARIYELKKRDGSKPLVLFVKSLEQARELISISELMLKLLESWWPGPMTFIAKSLTDTYSYCHPGTPLLGIRIPANKHALNLIREIDEPLAVTSFNMSGEPEIHDMQQLKSCFSGNVRQFIGHVDQSMAPSIVVMQTSPNNLKVLRYTADQIDRLISDCSMLKGIAVEF